MTSLFPQRFVCSAVAAAVLMSVSACQTPGPLQQGSSTGAPATQLSPAEQQMRADSDRFNSTVIGGVLTGAAAGALAGGLAALLTGGNSKEVRNTALAGAVVGGTIGGIDGYVTAKKEQAGRGQIRELQAAAADVRQDNQKLQAYLDSSGSVLNEGKSRLAEAARKREEQNIASMNTTLAQAKKTRDQYTQASAKMTGSIQDRRDIDAEIARMNKQVAQLESNITEYNKALAVSRA
jgi:hypothetical protein